MDDRIVELDDAAPAPPPTGRDRAVIGGLAGAVLAIGLAVVVARSPVLPVQGRLAPFASAAPSPPLASSLPVVPHSPLRTFDASSCRLVVDDNPVAPPRFVCADRTTIYHRAGPPPGQPTGP